VTDALLSSGEGRIIITACRAEQKSWIGNGKLSIYTQALVDSLSGGGYVPNNNGYIGAFGLYEHLYAAVKEAAEALGKVQEPVLTVLKGVGPFPVALYRGATDLGTFGAEETLPQEAPVRRVDPARSARMFAQKIKNVAVTASGERAVAIGGNASASTIITGNENTVQRASGRNVAQSSGGPATTDDHSRSTVFDQRGQKVQYQYNAAGDIDLGAAQNRTEAVAELRKPPARASTTRGKQARLTKTQARTRVPFRQSRTAGPEGRAG